MNLRAAVSPALNELKAYAAYFTIAIVVAMGMVNAQSVAAQNASQVIIPFAFSANHKSFPPGHYRVIRESENYLEVVSIESGVTAGLLVRTTRTLEAKPRNSLVFLRDERGYHLLTVRFAQGGVGVQTELAVQPKAEREIAKATDGATMEVGMN